MIELIREFRDRWENASEPFDDKIRAWTGKKSEGYRLLTALLEELSSTSTQEQKTADPS